MKSSSLFDLDLKVTMSNFGDVSPDTFYGETGQKPSAPYSYTCPTYDCWSGGGDDQPVP